MMAWLSDWYGFLSQLDQGLQRYLPIWLRLLFWPALAYLLARLFYRLALPREKMKEWQLELLFQQQLQRTFRQLGSSWSGRSRRKRGLQLLVYGLRPLVSLLALVFLFSLLLWLPQRFAWHSVGAGSTVLLSPQSEEPSALRTAAQAQVRPAQRVYWSDKLQAWTVLWPGAGEQIEFRGSDGKLWFTVSGHEPGTQVAPASWWQRIWPALQLESAAPFEWVQIERRPRYYLPWGPSWLRSWWFPPLLLALVWFAWRAWRHWRQPGRPGFFARIRPQADETPKQLIIKIEPKPAATKPRP